ncbi:hypothetical protein JJB09_21230 [Rhizobium sp. KVB221]|uniref:Uncharacterized protein n=1 Tax=Rhizobium setariae TaxID=2801340 RepID=A0A937CP59_9HYPH|nr:hypothetical protein [Rhizobium setariae]MBL0374541.1 hypothetical protein [Rhizobium setariae]
MSNAPDNFMMIGLHKLAAERGGGLIPELLALYQDRQQEPMSQRNAPASDPSTKCAGNDNVIAFRPYLLAKRRR